MGYLCVCHATVEVYRNEHEQEEDGAGDLQGSETVLDHTDSVLAMGAGRRRHQDR